MKGIKFRSLFALLNIAGNVQVSDTTKA